MDITGTNGNDTLTGTQNRDDITGRSGDDLLVGLGGNDDLYGNGGDDTLDGGAGNDTFVFARGRDVIEDFGDDDVIELASTLGVSNFGDVIARAEVTGGGDDVLIDFGGGNTLRLEDVQLSSLNSDDFTFV